MHPKKNGNFIRLSACPHLGEHRVDQLLHLCLLLHEILALPLLVHVDRLLLLLRHLSEDRDALLIRQGVSRSRLGTNTTESIGTQR